MEVKLRNQACTFVTVAVIWSYVIILTMTSQLITGRKMEVKLRNQACTFVTAAVLFGLMLSF